ncbi:hypothetical protein [Burkholderia multivorans]|uniref:hypothetical protein n=1 Tax=Burkholderia multivorans TaxID=87883 RepID=UPI0021598E78|nr:hypothetical protein [Burkholderia multivorans]
MKYTTRDNCARPSGVQITNDHDGRARREIAGLRQRSIQILVDDRQPLLLEAREHVIVGGRVVALMQNQPALHGRVVTKMRRAVRRFSV